MAITNPLKTRLENLKRTYDKQKVDKDSLLQILDEAELPESVYNSNAIENSTLTLRETEKILLELEVGKEVSLREVFETKNLAKIIEYERAKIKEIELDFTLLLFLHKILLNNINEKIAGRFREKGEFVRIGSFVAIPPEHIENELQKAIISYSGNLTGFFIDKIAKFHLDFETLHPFNDGNGRIGRVIVNFQLAKLGFPHIIIRDKEKKDYYTAFDEYRADGNTKKMERIICLAVMESLHKRIAYLESKNIIKLADYANKINKPAPVLYNRAKRQSIPAFREKGIWKIGI